MTRIFISYSRQDERFARQLATSLDEAGVDVWIDVDDIPAGMKWSSAIQQGLKISDIMIVVVSPSSMRSGNVEDEWQYFLDQEKPVVPVLYRPAEVHFQLNRMQYIDFYGEAYEKALAMLYAELIRMGADIMVPPGMELPDSTNPTRPKTLGRRPIEGEAPKRSRTPLILGIVLLLLIVGGGAALFATGTLDALLGGGGDATAVIAETEVAEATIPSPTVSPTEEATATETPTDAPTETPTPIFEPTVAPVTLTASSPRNVRRSNTLGSRVIGTLPLNQSVPILGRNDENRTWYYVEVEINGVLRRGWVSEDATFRIEGDLDSVPVLDPGETSTFPPTATPEGDDSGNEG